MLRVVTGPFHPHLESRLVDCIRVLKATDPLNGIALIVPSSSLADHLRQVLVRTHGLSFLNLHLLTFHQLALRLASERVGNPSAGIPVMPIDSLFYEQLIRQVLRRGSSSLRAFDHVPHSSGTWGALWATVRDLKDGAVDPEVALRGLDEGYFDEDDSVWLRALFSLHAAIDTICRTLAVGTPDDLANAVRSLVPESNFLGSLQQVLYYGFYDLTQVQLSLFEAVVKRTPTTLFFPSEGGTTGTFARRFFERYIVPLASGPNAIANCSPKHEERDARLFCPLLTVHSVIGAEEELSSVCRQILDLVETHGYQFDEIGMVGRTLEPYQPYLASIFDRYRVPFTSTSGRPLIHEPLAKLVLQLATVPLHDGYRGTVLDAITSPLYRSERHARAPEHVRPDLWKVIAQALSIAHGRDEWARLERGAPQAWSIGGRRDEDATEPTLKVSTGVTRMLWETVSELLDECDEIPTDGTPGELVSALLRVVARHVTAENPEKEKGDASHRTDAAVWESLDAVLASVSDLDRIGERFTWTEFTEVLTHAMERATMPFASTFQSGVAVLDAMEARGRSFRALFVVGMNEQVFPRYVREDPFLRDRHRRVLADTLGFKVDEKLSAYDEEALLFTLLCRSAKNHLVLSVQRADGQGRPLVESPYVSDVERILETGAPPRIVVPRTLGDRVSACPEQWKVFAREDLAVWLVLRGQDPSFLLDAVGRDSELYRKGVEALAQIESSVLHVSDFDGMTGPLQSVEQRVEAVGLSPTALERYGRCPFQYYCADVLDLKPILSAPSHDLDPRMLGTLCHTALRETYAELMALGWPQTQVSDGHIAEIVQTSVARATIACENQGTFGPYLLWQLAQEQVCFLCAQVIELDHADYLEQGFLPVGLEMAATGYLTLEQGDGKQTIKIHGRADRLDQHRERGSIRVVDYKFTLGSSMSADDRKLDQAALRGVRLQPPIYSRLHFEGFPPPTEMQLLFLAPRWTPPIVRSQFDAATWSGVTGDRLGRTLRVLVDGLRQGRFFMLPDAYCDTCDYRAACRRGHSASWWRVMRSPEASILKELRRYGMDDEQS